MIPDRLLDPSLEVFISAQVSHLSGGNSFEVSDLLFVAKEGHIIIVLDGFDEVADIPTRRRVVREITEGAARIQAHDRSAQVVVTSRPAAFANSPGFEDEDWIHLEIQSMSPNQIDLYANKWMTARRLHAREKNDFSKLLTEKLEQPHMRDLARNPMQLTILLALIHTRGLSLPDKRTALYDNYMELFFNRESEKSRIVREYRDLLIDIHRFLAWHLHVAAEGGSSNGGISDKDLRKLLKSYLDEEGHDTSLVDAIFTGMVERVVALVSRVEGTFEFEVQPLREYFAARHLYETAPYSPPGSERPGTKPERFDALARNFYWLNVLRFFCGCFSRGELSSLVDGLHSLARTDGYKDIDHSRSVSVMLLSDWGFTQQPLSVRRVIGDIFDQPGLKRFLLSASSQSSVPFILPERCGRAELIEYAYAALVQVNNLEDRRSILNLIRQNSVARDRMERWLSEEPPIRLSPSVWLADGRILGLLRILKPLHGLELVHKYGSAAILELLKSRRYDVLALEENVFSEALYAVLDCSYDPPLYPNRGEDLTLLDSFMNITSVQFYNFIWAGNEQMSFRHAVRRNVPFSELQVGNRKIKPTGALDHKLSQVLSTFYSHFDLELSAWTSSIVPWQSLVDACIQNLGSHWRFARLAILASGLRSTTERGRWSSDGWAITLGLSERMRFARLKSNNTRWWKQQIDSVKNTEREKIACTMLLTWCSPTVIFGLRSELTDIIDAWPDEYWETSYATISLCSRSASYTGENAAQISEKYDDVSPRLSAAIYTRFSDKIASIDIFSQLTDYAGNDKQVIRFLAYYWASAAGSDAKLWPTALNIYRHAQMNDVAVGFADTRGSTMPIAVGHEICSNAMSYPQSIVRSAQRSVASYIGSSAPKLGDVAEREGWFAS